MQVRHFEFYFYCFLFVSDVEEAIRQMELLYKYILLYFISFIYITMIYLCSSLVINDIFVKLIAYFKNS